MLIVWLFVGNLLRADIPKPMSHSHLLNRQYYMWPLLLLLLLWEGQTAPMLRPGTPPSEFFAIWRAWKMWKLREQVPNLLALLQASDSLYWLYDFLDLQRWLQNWWQWRKCYLKKMLPDRLLIGPWLRKKLLIKLSSSLFKLLMKLGLIWHGTLNRSKLPTPLLLSSWPANCLPWDTAVIHKHKMEIKLKKAKKSWRRLMKSWRRLRKRWRVKASCWTRLSRHSPSESSRYATIKKGVVLGVLLLQ
jgi:hypothetical protein